MLDYLENLSVCQIRKLYYMLSALAFKNPQEGGLIQVKQGTRPHLSGRHDNFTTVSVMTTVKYVILIMQVYRFKTASIV